jgi:hypothetical protein
MTDDHSLIMATLLVSECSKLTWLIALEEFITSNRPEGCKYFILRYRFYLIRPAFHGMNNDFCRALCFEKSINSSI